MRSTTSSRRHCFKLIRMSSCHNRGSSTVGGILKRHGLPYGEWLRSDEAPNADGYSRYVLRCESLRHSLYASVRRLVDPPRHTARMDPSGRPDPNGRHERMHLTLKSECCRE